MDMENCVYEPLARKDWYSRKCRLCRLGPEIGSQLHRARGTTVCSDYEFRRPDIFPTAVPAVGTYRSHNMGLMRRANKEADENLTKELFGELTLYCEPTVKKPFTSAREVKEKPKPEPFWWELTAAQQEAQFPIYRPQVAVENIAKQPSNIVKSVADAPSYSSEETPELYDQSDGTRSTDESTMSDSELG